MVPGMSKIIIWANITYLTIERTNSVQMRGSTAPQRKPKKGKAAGKAAKKGITPTCERSFGKLS